MNTLCNHKALHPRIGKEMSFLTQPQAHQAARDRAPRQHFRLPWGRLTGKSRTCSAPAIHAELGGRKLDVTLVEQWKIPSLRHPSLSATQLSQKRLSPTASASEEAPN